LKLILAVVRDADEMAVVDQLVNVGYRVTRMSSTGGFLRRGNVTLMVGAEEEQLQNIIDLIQKTCTTADGFQNRAVIFVLNAVNFQKI
jgi:uncharacterized protein YaaQ